MTTYIIRRLLQGVVVLFLASFMIYSILILTPGGPKDQIARLKNEAVNGHPTNPKLIEIYTKLYGLDKPYPINYLVWLFDPNKTADVQYDIQGNPVVMSRGIDIFGIKGSGVLTGDLGNSVSIDVDKPVLNLMGQRIGNTLILMGLSTLLSIILALPIGIISAVRQYS